MKFCPKCGAQLPDEAKFCSKCGAKQPQLENENVDVVTPTPEPTSKPDNSPVPDTFTPNTQESDSELFQRLKRDDPRFNAIMKATTMKSLALLVNAIGFIVFMIFLLVPCLTFTGEGCTSDGLIGLNATLVFDGTFPFSVNRFTAATLHNYSSALGKAFSPSSSMDAGIIANTYIILVFGLLINAMFILTALLNGLRKSYRLKEYKKDGGVVLYKELKTKPGWVLGVGPILFLIVDSVLRYIGWCDLTYKDGDTYLFGKITGDNANMIACIVSGVICSAIIIVVNAVMQIKATNIAKQYYEQGA